MWIEHPLLASSVSYPSTPYQMEIMIQVSEFVVPKTGYMHPNFYILVTNLRTCTCSSDVVAH